MKDAGWNGDRPPKVAQGRFYTRLSARYVFHYASRIHVAMSETKLANSTCPLTFPPGQHPTTSTYAAAVAPLLGPHWLVLTTAP